MCAVWLILAGALVCGAQLLPDVTPEPKPQPKPSASLLVTTDLDCNWKLDGVSQGQLKADSAKTVRLSPGKHLVQAFSNDRQDKWQAFVTVGQSGQEGLQILLSSVRQARLEKEQEEAAERRLAEGRRHEAERIGKWEFVRIPAGEFDMGCSPGDRECYDDEKPQHHVRIRTSFEIGKYLVTQTMWKSVMGSNPSRFKGPGLPVETVSWNDVQEFLQRLNARNDGYHYRLPTEAEWEYAARAGSMPVRYGNLDAIAWYWGNSGKETHPVGQMQPNAWGLYDMLGNVWEWVQDWYDQNFYQHSPDTDPQGPSTGQHRVLRGNSWDSGSGGVRVSVRGWDEPDDRNYGSGFRCVREVAD
jgi:formylglycine-generating enzyme required for sulfatase activity